MVALVQVLEMFNQSELADRWYFEIWISDVPATI